MSLFPVPFTTFGAREPPRDTSHPLNSRRVQYSSKLLRDYLKDNKIPLCSIVNQYTKWVNQQYQVVFESNDGQVKFMDSIKRGDSSAYSRLYWRFEAIARYFDSFDYVFKKTKKFYWHNGQRKRVYLCNTLFLTYTYGGSYRDFYRSWIECGKDFNRHWTGLKSKLSRNIRGNNRVRYFIRCWEAQDDGTAHIHVLVKLLNPVECVFMWSKSKKKLLLRVVETYVDRRKIVCELHNDLRWKYGFSDILGVVKYTDAEGNLYNPVSYIAKYIIKVNKPLYRSTYVRSLAMLWILLKKSFSCTRLNKRLNCDNIHQVGTPDITVHWENTGFIINDAFYKRKPRYSRAKLYKIYLNFVYSRCNYVYSLFGSFYSWAFSTKGELKQLRLT